MTALHRDLWAPELWSHSIERSRRRRVAAPRLRRQAARRRHVSTAMAATMLAGPGTQIAAAHVSSPGPAQPDIASESPATRAIGGPTRPGEALLKLGSVGRAVAAVQRRLELRADGVFGENTDRAVRVFQKGEGLEVDGVVGRATWEALFGGYGRSAAGGSRASAGTVPALAGLERRNTSYAVRRAGRDELRKAGVADGDAPAPEGRDSGLVAIELRVPAADSEGSAGRLEVDNQGVSPREPSRASEGAAALRGTGGQNQRSNLGSERGPDGADGHSARDARDRAEVDTGTAPESAEKKPEGEVGTARPRGGRGEPPSGGSCRETLTWPTKGKNITSRYRSSSRPSHAGIDIDGGLSDEGDPIYAAACGVIGLMQNTSSSGGYGNYVCVEHTDEFVTCYAHLSGFAEVDEGDYVRRGQVIGYLGNTGHSFGAHLHFETRRGVPYRGGDYSDFDPAPYLAGREIPGRPVRASSDIGGPDLQLPPQGRSASGGGAPAAVEAASDEDPGGLTSPARSSRSVEASASSALIEPAESSPEGHAARASEAASTADPPAGEQPPKGMRDDGQSEGPVRPESPVSGGGEDPALGHESGRDPRVPVAPGVSPNGPAQERAGADADPGPEPPNPAPSEEGDEPVVESASGPASEAAVDAAGRRVDDSTSRSTGAADGSRPDLASDDGTSPMGTTDEEERGGAADDPSEDHPGSSPGGPGFASSDPGSAGSRFAGSPGSGSSPSGIQGAAGTTTATETMASSASNHTPGDAPGAHGQTEGAVPSTVARSSQTRVAAGTAGEDSSRP